MTAKLFTPVDLGGITLPNRIVVSPMCQYSSVDGSAQSWHQVHYGMLSMSGAGLLCVEATHVEREGRITRGCAGLYSDDNETALKPIVEWARGWNSPSVLAQDLPVVGESLGRALNGVVFGEPPALLHELAAKALDADGAGQFLAAAQELAASDPRLAKEHNQHDAGQACQRTERDHVRGCGQPAIHEGARNWRFDIDVLPAHHSGENASYADV